MTHPRSPYSTFLASLLIALIALPNAVYAQGFEFGEEEAEEVEEVVEEEDDGQMSFSSDDLSKEDATEEEKPQVALVVIPTADVERNRDLQAELNKVGGDIPGIVTMGPETVLPGLQQREAEQCVTDPICLGAVGDEGKVGRILILRVKEGDSGLELNADYFDVQDRLFVKYHTVKGLSSTSDLVEAVEPALNEIFSIRPDDGSKDYVGKEDTGIVQDIVAFGAAGLAVAAFGGGIAMGLKASGKEQEVEDTKSGDGYTMTQVEADAILREADDAATTANILYGLSAALAVTSAVFFFIRGGSDVADDQKNASLIHDFQIAPIITETGAGFGAGFRF